MSPVEDTLSQPAPTRADTYRRRAYPTSKDAWHLSQWGARVRVSCGAGLQIVSADLLLVVDVGSGRAGSRDIDGGSMKEKAPGRLSRN